MPGPQLGKFVGTGAGESGVANADGGAGDAIDKGFDGAVLVRSAQVVDASRHVPLNQQGLQSVGDLVGKAPGDRELALEHRHPSAQLLEQFLVREPDQIVEVHRNQLIVVADLEFQLGPGRGRLEAVEHVGESASVAQGAGGFLEIVVPGGLAKL